MHAVHRLDPLLPTDLPLAQELQNLVWATANDVLLAVHDSRHTGVLPRDEALLQEEGLVVPGDDAAAELEGLAYAQGLSEADGGCPDDNAAPKGSEGLEDSVARVQGEASEIALPQVACVVHVAQVHVVRKHPSTHGLLPRHVPHMRLEPGSDQRGSCSEVVPHIQTGEENQQHCQSPQQGVPTRAAQGVISMVQIIGVLDPTV